LQGDVIDRSALGLHRFTAAENSAASGRRSRLRGLRICVSTRAAQRCPIDQRGPARAPRAVRNSRRDNLDAIVLETVTMAVVHSVGRTRREVYFDYGKENSRSHGPCQAVWLPTDVNMAADFESLQV
jgi:hypothetical protein